MKALHDIRFPRMMQLTRSQEERQYDASNQFRLNQNFKRITDSIVDLEKIVAKLQANSPEHMLAAIYPVGSIYINLSSVNPTTFLGGTWEQVQDCLLLASGLTHEAGSDTTFDVGGSGGSMQCMVVCVWKRIA